MKEIDALIAEKVFGYIWVKTKDCDYFRNDYFGKQSCMANRLHQKLAWLIRPEQYDPSTMDKADIKTDKTIINTKYITIGNIGAIEPYYSGYESPGWGMPKKYSSNIDAAFEVVNWLRNRWGQIEIVAGIKWHCYPDNNAEDYVKKMGSHDTPAMAICIAALIEAGMKKEEIEDIILENEAKV